MRNQVGFIYNENLVVDKYTGYDLDHLLTRLNRKFCDLFPYVKWNDYHFIQCEQLEQLQDYELIICLGRDAYIQAKEYVRNQDLNVKVLKVSNLFEVSKRNTRLVQNSFKVRTNYKLLEAYNVIERALLN